MLSAAFAREDVLNPNLIWHFWLSGRESYAPRIGFAEDGRILFYCHPNEHGWLLNTDGSFCLTSADGRVTAMFNNIKYVDASWHLEGVVQTGPEAGLSIYLRSTLLGASKISTRSALLDKIDKYGWEIGDYSYGVPHIFEEHCAGLTIGKFSSIALGACIALGNHRSDFVTLFLSVL